MKKILFLALLLVLNYLSAQELEFYREDLNFEIRENHFLVKGYYYFRNNSPQLIKRTLFYPFPTSEIYGTIDSLFAFSDSTDSRDVLLSQNEKGALFKIELEANSEAIYHIGYRQELFAQRAEYILTSTSTWGQALQEVNYSLILPKSLQLLSLSYLPDELSEQADFYRLQWHKTDFLPQHDFIVEFRKMGE
ncbi:MAG: hypothetical protein R6U84_08915 [Candidatus Cloacimonadales bacterium]